MKSPDTQKMSKNDIISEGPSFRKKIIKKVKMFNFSNEFSSKIEKTFAILSNPAFFVETHKKLTHELLDSFEKYTKIMHFLRFSAESFENFGKFSAVLGDPGPGPPPPPTRPTPRKYFSRAKNPA